MENFEKYIPTEELSPEEKQKVEALEQDTDRIYATRAELYSLYDNFKDYLSILRKGKKAHWEELSEWSSKSKLKKRLDFKKLKLEIEKQDLNKEEKADELANKKAEILSSVEEAIILYQNLKETGGTKPSLNLFSQAKQQNETSEFYKFRMGELGQARLQLSHAESLMNINRRRYNSAASSDLLKDPGRIRRMLNEEYLNLENKYHKILYSSPETYLAATRDQIKQMKQVFDENGTIVETPYVKEKMARIIDTIKEGRPVFIHGELGSGKTELAKHLSRKELSNVYLARWGKNNPKPEEKAALREWMEKRKLEAEILEVRGLRSLEKEDLLAKTLIEREETPLPEEQARFFNEAWEKYKETVLKKTLLVIEGEEQKKEFIERNEQRLEKAYFEKWRSNIKTVEKLSPIFQAMKQGRPVLIDEMNAIPHHVLIVLNDIINKKPGEAVFTPNGEEIIVQEGFCVIATGNWKPEDGKMYIGRQPIDAAFLSRFSLVDYDFLPQAKTFDALLESPEGEESTRKKRQQNELFKMMVVRLLDRQLGLRAPEGTLEKISNLAVVARVLQDVFSEKEVDRTYYFKERGVDVSPSEVLQENVLSLRHLIPIIENWGKDGFVKDLDDYIFLDYVGRSKARPKEMKYVYQQLKLAGFFQGSDWPNSMDEAELQKMVDYPIIKKMYGVDEMTGREKAISAEVPKLKYYSQKEIIEVLFGPAPKRKKVTQRIVRPEQTTETREDILLELSAMQEFQDLIGQTGIDDFKEDFLEQWKSEECEKELGEFVF